MEENITLEALELLSDADDTADNSVKKLKSGVKQYSERLNKDREKIKAQLEAEYKSNLSKLLGVEIKDLTQEEIDKAIEEKIGNSDAVIKANEIIKANNDKLIQEALDENIKKINAINSDIDTVEKLCAHPQYDAIKAKVDKGYDLYDAYISVVGFNNQTTGNTTVKKGIDAKTISYVQPETMSAETLALYERAFPGKTKEEIIAMYRRDSK